MVRKQKRFNGVGLSKARRGQNSKTDLTKTEEGDADEKKKLVSQPWSTNCASMQLSKYLRLFIAYL